MKREEFCVFPLQLVASGDHSLILQNQASITFDSGKPEQGFGLLQLLLQALKFLYVHSYDEAIERRNSDWRDSIEISH
jgi:hypothetical protein